MSLAKLLQLASPTLPVGDGIVTSTSPSVMSCSMFSTVSSADP